ncbi:MAG: STAS domain-containing protein [Rickettsiales bacterium]|nr:STAS domain-containing protein [Pseudomonadota bacterium]MDA0965479.1 STAS domain-containing protein [Pseudomonadota bacterium]MDG4542803.1 STAS domain-containing protein [Rickettsiales bacterium]MDG4544749.1 STAS domain-containing protein [Rickettsiales bacterium]MDG4546871.1 STAS domain-containing protein [Rickettsiales bacterium]
MEYVKTINGATCDIKMQGKFTFADHGNFKDVIGVFNDSGLKQIEINLDQVEFVDSAALGLFLLVRDEAKKTNKTIVLKSPQGQVKKMFEISRFYELFDVK